MQIDFPRQANVKRERDIYAEMMNTFADHTFAQCFHCKQTFPLNKLRLEREIMEIQHMVFKQHIWWRNFLICPACRDAQSESVSAARTHNNSSP